MSLKKLVICLVFLGAYSHASLQQDWALTQLPTLVPNIAPGTLEHREALDLLRSLPVSNRPWFERNERYIRLSSVQKLESMRALASLGASSRTRIFANAFLPLIFEDQNSPFLNATAALNRTREIANKGIPISSACLRLARYLHQYVDEADPLYGSPMVKGALLSMLLRDILKKSDPQIVPFINGFIANLERQPKPLYTDKVLETFNAADFHGSNLDPDDGLGE